MNRNKGDAMSSLTGGIDLGLDMFAPKNRSLAAMKGENEKSSAKSSGSARSHSGSTTIKSASFGQKQPEPSYNLDMFGDLNCEGSGGQSRSRPSSRCTWARYALPSMTPHPRMPFRGLASRLTGSHICLQAVSYPFCT